MPSHTRNTQLFLQEESDTCRVIDPWGGSYHVEKLTHDLANRAWEHIKEIEETGGMAAAIEAGIPKMRIEESAARIQARIDSGRQIVIGVNRYQLEQEEEIDVLRVDNAQVRSDQISRLEKLKSERDTEKCLEQLEALTRCAETGEGNLLALAVNAARAHATVGEISEAIGKSFWPAYSGGKNNFWSV